MMNKSILNGNNFYEITKTTIRFWGLDIKEPFEVHISEGLKKFIKEKNLAENEVCEFNDDVDIELFNYCLLLRNDLETNDERIALMRDLMLLGLSERDARIIALEAGASQVYVNSEYLEQFKIEEKLKVEIKTKLCKFYMGE